MSGSSPMRPQPPSIEDPERNDFEGWEPGTDEEEGEQKDEVNWARLAKDALQFSTTYIDSNHRMDWEDSLRAFNNQHKSSSKYNSEAFRKRSTLYRPKTRAIIRKNEAAAAAAFFSNLDIVSITPSNEADQKQRISADITKELLQYRLTKSVNWFLFVCGAFQDAQVQGVCYAHVYWRFTSRKDKDGKLEPVDDMPCVDLIPVENMRVDPSCSWNDPIGTSPYLIHLMPMYVCDVKQRMTTPDPKGRTWKQYSNTILKQYMDSPDDSTRQTRLGKQQDPSQLRRQISDYDIVWVHRHIHRRDGMDFEFYTLGSERMLTEPEPLSNAVFHGKRPYVMGMSVLETHKPMPSSIPKLVDGLQEEANEVSNQRLDNVKLVLNKRWLVKRGKNVDMASLIRNVPGGITQADNLEEDVKEINWQDVTQSSYLEQDRINADFDNLAGDFNAASVQMSRSPREPARALTMLQAPATLLTEYLIKTVVETLILPVLRQLVLLEQFYETDATVLALAGEKAQVRQKFGVDEVTDQMLEQELTINVNVGMGATDPVTKLQRFVYGVQNFAQISAKPPPGVNLTEVAKEIFALSGYQDGSRFLMGKDPELLKMQQTIKQLSGVIQQLKMREKDKHEANVVKLQTAREKNVTTLASTAMKQQHESKHLLVNHLMEMERAQLPPPIDPNQLAKQEAQNAAQSG